MTTMRAKLKVTNVEGILVGEEKSSENLAFTAVCKNDYDESGLDENNTFSKFTPSADLKMSVSNPALFDKFAVGDEVYVDFTKV